jgi:hypothetical protein
VDLITEAQLAALRHPIITRTYTFKYQQDQPNAVCK